MEEIEKERSLRSLVEEQTSLKWIFVGGKGGVGKTTCSCSLAVQLSKHRSSVLLISTDPAHNVSDAFNQKLSKTPTKVEGFENLFAMEIDANLIESSATSFLDDFGDDASSSFRFNELLQSFPGVDEAMSYIQVLKLIQSFEFDCVVFDTAPTGHTLRLLSLPAVIEKSFSKLIGLKSTIQPIFNSITSLIGGGRNSDNSEIGAATSLDSVTAKMEDLMPTIKQINREFSDATKTTFICVAIAEFLSLYETERLIQSLAKCQIDCHTIIVNQLLSIDGVNAVNSLNSSENEKKERKCQFCEARIRLQSKYLQQFIDLYEEDDDFTLVLIPQLLNEIRGKDNLLLFSKYLVN